jgi:hypothetical protein
MRWLYNYHYRLKQNNLDNSYSEDINDNNNEWITPEFCKIKPKQTKRISPDYLYISNEQYKINILSLEGEKRKNKYHLEDL